jgi:hypothetical protein
MGYRGLTIGDGDLKLSPGELPGRDGEGRRHRG